MSKRIVYYYPSNKRTIGFNSIMKELMDKGYEVYLLTTCERGLLHEDLERIHVRTFANPLIKGNAIIYYLKQILFLIRFCRMHKIDVVLSNLQHVNLIAVFAQYFTRAKIIIYRHHFKYHHLSNDTKMEEAVNRNEALFDRIINKRAKKIIVPAESVKNGMVQFEKADAGKIEIMPYLYDFSKYNRPNEERIMKLKEQYKAQLILIMCSRLIVFKRHHIVFPVIERLVHEKGMDIKLLVLDEGPQEDVLKEYIAEKKLQQHIFMLGYQTNFIDYMVISDLMIHPSLTEASNSAVKEMAMLGKTAVVCDGVGDFSDYFSNEENGFLISAVDSQQKIEEIIIRVYTDKMMLQEMGKQLNKTVTKRFSISEQNVDRYIACFSSP